MGFPVRDCDIAVPSLLHMPDDLFHHHQMAEVRVPGRHEPGQDMELALVAYRIGDHLVIAVADDDPPADKIRDFREVHQSRSQSVKFQIRKMFLDLKRWLT